MEKLLSVYKDYAFSFDMNEWGIGRKYYHTLRTIELSEQIATDLKLDTENIYLAKVIALFHDIYRFEQWTKYKTFKDTIKVDHGDLAINLLFDEKFIEKFGIAKKYYDVIKFAVKNHNKLYINLDELPDNCKYDCILHAEIVRDADKLDIAKQLSTDHPPLFNVKDESKIGISDKVLDDTKNHRLVDYKYVISKSDRILTFIAQAFDLNTKYAQRYYIDQNYAVKIIDRYKNIVTEAEYLQLKQLALNINEYLI